MDDHITTLTQKDRSTGQSPQKITELNQTCKEMGLADMSRVFHIPLEYGFFYGFTWYIL